MKIFYTYSPEKDPSLFSRAVLSFTANPNHELVVLCSVDSESEANDFASALFTSFGDVDVIAKSVPSPKRAAEYLYFESRIISSLHVKYPNLGAALFLGRDDVPTSDGWCNTIQNLILSSGKALTGYAKPYRGGVLYPDSLLTNGFFNTFLTPKFTHSTTHLRHSIRHEAVHHGSIITDELIPLSGSPCEVSKSDSDKLAESRDNLKAMKAKVEETKVKAASAHDKTRNLAKARQPTERSMVQPKPPEGTVTTFGVAFTENEKITFTDGLGRSPDDDTVHPEEATISDITLVETPVDVPVEVPVVEEVKPPVKKVAKKAPTKRAKRKPSKKATKKSK